MTMGLRRSRIALLAGVMTACVWLAPSGAAGQTTHAGAAAQGPPPGPDSQVQPGTPPAR